LASGNTTFVLLYYQKLLGIDYVIGSTPKMNGDTIVGITEAIFQVKNLNLMV